MLLNSHRIIRSSTAAPAPQLSEVLAGAPNDDTLKDVYDDDYNEPHISTRPPPTRTTPAAAVVLKPLILRAQPSTLSYGSGVRPLPVAEEVAPSGLNSRCVVPTEEPHPFRDILGVPPPLLDAPAVGYQRSRMFLRRYMDPSPPIQDDGDLSPLATLATGSDVNRFEAVPAVDLRQNEPKDVLARREDSTQTAGEWTSTNAAAVQGDPPIAGISTHVPMLTSRSKSNSPSRRGLPDPHTLNGAQGHLLLARPQQRNSPTQHRSAASYADPAIAEPAAAVDASGSSPPRTPALSATRLFHIGQSRQYDAIPLAEPHRADSPPHSGGSHPERFRENTQQNVLQRQPSARSSSAPAPLSPPKLTEPEVLNPPPSAAVDYSATSPRIHPSRSGSPRERSAVSFDQGSAVAPLRRSNSMPAASPSTAQPLPVEPTGLQQIPSQLAPKNIPRVNSTVPASTDSARLQQTRSIVVPSRTLSVPPRPPSSVELTAAPHSGSESTVAASGPPDVTPKGLPRGSSSAALGPPPVTSIPRTRTAASIERSDPPVAEAAAATDGESGVSGSRSAPLLRDSTPKSVPRSNSVPAVHNMSTEKMQGPPASLLPPRTAPVATAPPARVPSVVPVGKEAREGAVAASPTPSAIKAPTSLPRQGSVAKMDEGSQHDPVATLSLKAPSTLPRSRSSDVTDEGSRRSSVQLTSQQSTVSVVPPPPQRLASSVPARSSSVSSSGGVPTAVVPKGLPRSSSSTPDRSRPSGLLTPPSVASIPRSRSTVGAESQALGTKTLSVPARPSAPGSLRNSPTDESANLDPSAGSSSVRIGRPKEARVAPIISANLLPPSSGSGSKFRSMAPPPKINSRKVPPAPFPAAPSDGTLTKNFSVSFGPVVSVE